MQFSSRLPVVVHILLAIVKFEGKEKTTSVFLALFHFHENPNSECPVGKNVHTVLDNRLLAIQEAMKQQMKLVTLQDLIDVMNNMLIRNE